LNFITETDVLRKRTSLFDDSFVTSESYRVLQRILLKQEFQRKIAKQIREELEYDRRKHYEKIQKTIRHLRHELA